tara:strand:+ start:30 stop:449 length:420 start_codon:yes stop_codon:yes gene_type:complete
MFRKLLFLSLFFSFSVYSQDTNSVTVTRIIGVYDGDTFRVDIDELSDIVGKNIAIRILGIDTPEIKGKCDKEKQLAIKARDFTRSYLNNASSVQLSNLKRDKYFRLLADVYVDGESLAAALLANDLAVRYSGKKKLTWC